MVILFFTLFAGGAAALYSGDKTVFQIYTVCSSSVFALIAIGGLKKLTSTPSEEHDDKLRLLTEKNIQLQKKNAKESESLQHPHGRNPVRMEDRS
jgi:hypothetical protein